MGSNGIERESIGPEQARLCLSRHSMTVESLTRNLSGNWTIVIDLAADFCLPDGRRVEVREAIFLRGKQKGRRPRTVRRAAR